MLTTVLIASSYPLIVEGIKTVLENNRDVGTVLSAESYQETIEEIKKVAPDVVILTQQIKDGYGLDVIKACKAEHPSMKFLLMSYMSQIKVFEQAVEAGASGVLFISATKDELFAAISAALTNEIYVQPKLASLLFGNRKMSADGEFLLTPRQQQTIELIAAGYTNKEIAFSLSLSIETVNTHVKQILKKLKAKDRAQATAIAFRKPLIS
ncbi:MAG: hypothetical protein AUK32_02080 [Candidatus Aquicultor secundus]|nr:response regulator transcription factor [Candidatus Aquicultor secundus]NCO65887.1 response regulator transcription factor [Solirubrobacter sp.]OIO88188.1 MAG: hypothetical protein AUK32_02080 [Candidatus Aquicultor secundus]